MPKKRKKLKLGLRHFLPALVFVLVASSVAFYGSTQVKPSHADTAAYYSCNSGDSLSGSTCTHKSTYNATASTSYSCSHGGSLSGSTCYYSGCPNGYASSGSSCTYSYSACSAYPGSQFDNWEFQYYGYCLTFDHYPTSGQTSCAAGYYYVKGQNGVYGCYQKHATQCQNGGTNDNAGTCNVSVAPSCGSDSVSGTTCYYGATASTTYSCNNGDTQNGSICTHTTTYTATYHPATTSGSTGSTGGGTTGTSSGSSTTNKSTSGTKSTNTPVTITPVQPPSAPTGLKAEVVSSKVVQLSWMAGQAAAGVQNYEVERSLDNTTWVPLGPASDTSFTDTGTDFATKYYYRVREVDNSGANSDYATTNVTTAKFSSTGSVIISDDKLVMVSIPNGAFDRDVSCSVSSPDGELPSVPTKSLLVGPYSILCISSDGTTIGSFKKPLKVTIDLSGASGGFGAVAARLYDDTSGSDAKATYDAKAHKISFELTANKSFAVYGKKQGIGLTPFVLVALLIGGVGGALYLRRYWANRSSAVGQGELSLAAMPAASAAAATLAASATPSAKTFFEQAALKPSCTHLSMAHQVQPQTSGCAECTAEHKKWNALRICLTCGHVGCSDDSEEQHALKHYQQTGHPLIYEYGNPKGDRIGWCYIDQTYI